MTRFFGILTILLLINGNFASEEKKFTAETTTEDVRLFMFMNVANPENPSRSSLNVQDIKQKEESLNSTNKELLEVVLKEAESSTEYIVKSKPTIDMPYSVSQSSNRVTNLNTHQEEIQTNAASDHFAKPVLSSEELQNSNTAETGSAQINSQNSSTTAKNSTESLIEDTSPAFTVKITKPLNSWEDSLNSSLPERDLAAKNLPTIDPSQPLTSVTGSGFVSKDFKHLKNVPEEEEEEEEEEENNGGSSSKTLSSLNSSESVVVRIVLQEKDNSAKSQKRIELMANSSTGEDNTNTTLLDSWKPTETRKQAETEYDHKDSSSSSEKHEVIGDAPNNITELRNYKNTKSMAAQETAAKPTNSLDMFQNANLTATASDTTGQEAERKQEINTTNSSNSTQMSQNPNTTQSEEIINSTTQSKELLGDKVSETLNEYKIAGKPSNSFEMSDNLNMTENVVLRIVLKDARNLTGRRENSLQSSYGDAPAASKLFPKPSNSFHSSDTLLTQIVLKDATNLNSKSDNSLESSREVDTTTAAVSQPATNSSVISLEEYAVKQMDFILNHLLMETQEFVANVLQASINSVFPRDNLKRYAEALNQVLTPDNVEDYSDEVVEQNESTNPDKIYEEIVRKLNFLKSKPSKFLQKNLPPEWLNDFRQKKAETAIWLDKATDQMHQDLNNYISEEEDHIKYQYFNETFDDMSRATEIHQKLALLADLVKIIKNKKQITFTDLYMQT